MKPRASRLRSGLRIVAGAAVTSIVGHALVLAITPWLTFDLPADVLARARLEARPAPPDEFVLTLDLRTTAILAPAPPAEESEDPGLPEAPSEEEAQPFVDPAPEFVLETARIAEPEAAPLELAPVEFTPDPTSEIALEPPALANPAWEPEELATSLATPTPGAGRRSSAPALGAWALRGVALGVGFAATGPLERAPSGSTGGPSPAAGEEAAAPAPRLLEAPKPAYPEACRRRRIEGSVVCRMHVDRVGLVVGVDVVESSGDERLDRAAVRALERWRFDPPRRGGVKIESKVLHRVTFRLR